MERFSANVRMYPTEKNNGEKKDILPLRGEEIKSQKNKNSVTSLKISFMILIIAMMTAMMISIMR